MPVQKYKTLPNFIPSHSLNVEALQHTCERENKREMQRFHPELSGILGRRDIFIYTAKGSQVAYEGDWVVKDEDGKFHIYGDYQFRMMYTLAE